MCRCNLRYGAQGRLRDPTGPECDSCGAGNIAKWNKKEGEPFAAGDSLAEVETDKATMDWEAQDDGFVAKLLVDEGAKDISVGQPVLVTVEDEVRSPILKHHLPGASGTSSCDIAVDDDKSR